MKKHVFLYALALVSAFLVDSVVGPKLLNGRIGLHFAAGAAILIGMWRGWLPGLLSGWFVGWLMAGMTSEPLGMSMMSLGLAAVGASAFSHVVSQRIAFLNGLILLGFLLVENAISSLLAWGAFGVTPSIGVKGCISTAVVLTTLTHFGIYMNQFLTERINRGTSARRQEAPEL